MIWRLLAAIVAVLPWRGLRFLGRGLGFLAGKVVRVRRRHVVDCLERAGLEPAEVHADGMYLSLATSIFELLWTAGRRRDDLSSRVSIDEAGLEALQGAIGLGRGLVVAAAHTGNWDLAACAMAQQRGLAVVTKHLSWRSLDRFWQSMRLRRGVTLLTPSGAMRGAARVLTAGGTVAFMIDQAPGRATGIATCAFMNELADHDISYALLAARMRAPVAVMFGHREADGSHLLEVMRVLVPPEGAGRAWALETSREASACLEQFVRQNPSQWLWLHRRWRRQPRRAAGGALANPSPG